MLLESINDNHRQKVKNIIQCSWDFQGGTRFTITPPHLAGLQGDAVIASSNPSHPRMATESRGLKK